jgi:hypothetical protein
MDNIENLIPEWTDRRFEGLTREELRAAGKILGANFGANTGEATMRAKLCEIAGTLPPDEIPAPRATPITEAAANGMFEPKPNLTSSGEWGGRRHLVSIFHPGENTENSPKYVRLFHECEPRDFPYDEIIKLPEPMYQALKNTKRGDLQERRIKDKDGNLASIEHTTVRTPRYAFQYHGVDPDTASLPGSLTEYWRRQAKRTNNFAGLPRRLLIAIRSDLHGPAGRAFYKDLTNEDILVDILSFLGIDEFAAVA